MLFLFSPYETSLDNALAALEQLEAEQNKLAPKASKTIQARVQMQELDSRIASLANESSKLRRVLREKPWRL